MNSPVERPARERSGGCSATAEDTGPNKQTHRQITPTVRIMTTTTNHSRHNPPDCVDRGGEIPEHDVAYSPHPLGYEDLKLLPLNIRTSVTYTVYILVRRGIAHSDGRISTIAP